jgi:uncharacterized protein (UPF0332 family)
VSALKHIEAARAYLEKAREHLKREDPYDAAEKVWAAVWHATIALAEKYMGTTEPPKGWTWRMFAKESFIKAGLSEKQAGELAAYYIEVRKSLHGDCFYGRHYEEPEHKPLIEKAWEYVSLAEKLALEQQPSQ